MYVTKSIGYNRILMRHILIVVNDNNNVTSLASNECYEAQVALSHNAKSNAKTTTTTTTTITCIQRSCHLQ